MSDNPRSIAFEDKTVAIEAAGRAERRAHTAGESLASKPDDSGLEYGAKVRKAIKKSAS